MAREAKLRTGAGNGARTQPLGLGLSRTPSSPRGRAAAAPGSSARRLGFRRASSSEPVAVPLPTPTLPEARVPVPPALAAICSDRGIATAHCHSLGKSYLDLVRALPRALRRTSSTSSCARATSAEVEAVLEWAAGANVAVIPYGGGTSVVGGVEPRIPALRRRGRLDLGAAGPRARGRPRLARGADRRGRRRAAPEEQLARARADDALLPAVLRALDPRRLDRHARRRALRHRARRTSTTSSSVPCALITPERDLGVAAAAGLGRRPAPDRLLLGFARASSAASPRPGCACSREPPRARCAGQRGAQTREAGAEAVRASCEAGRRPANGRLLDALEAAAEAGGAPAPSDGRGSAELHLDPLAVERRRARRRRRGAVRGAS